MDELLKRAWAAGFIDGEGCISVVRCTHKGVAREQVQLLLDVGQSKREPLDHLVELFGGRVRSVRLGAFGWRLYGQKAGRVLEAVLPYLIVKRRQATLGLELLSLKSVQGRTRPDAVYARVLAIAEEFRALNLRRSHAERLSESAPQSDLRMVR